MIPVDQLVYGLARMMQRDVGDLNWTLIDMLRAAASATPDREALADPDREGLKYSELLALAEQTVTVLNGMGFTPTSRIAIAMPTSSVAAAAYVSVMAGMTILPLNPDLAADEYERQLQHARANAVLCEQGKPTAARAAAARLGIQLLELIPSATGAVGLFTLASSADLRVGAPQFAASEDIAVVIPTSGTTSLPKRVPRSQRELALLAYVTLAAPWPPNPVAVIASPLYHFSGFAPLLIALAGANGSSIVPPGDVAQFYRYLVHYRTEVVQGVPALLVSLLNEAEHHQGESVGLCLKFIIVGSIALPESLLQDLQQKLHVRVGVAYGLTETAAISFATIDPGAGSFVPGSVGKPVATAQVIISDETGTTLPPGETGEIVVRTVLLFRGYDNNPEANAEAFRAGWFRTGDSGYLDADGNLHVTGRVKEVINRGGSKVSPLEVDEVLLQHPAVLDAATFAFPHAVLGEDVATAVVVSDPSLTERDLRIFAAGLLPKFQIPSRFVFVSEIPRTAVGKIRRNLLTEQFTPRLQR